MYYGKSYRIQFTNDEGDLVQAYIRDTYTASVAAIPEAVYDLVPAADPVRIRALNREEDVFSMLVQSRECELTFLTTPQYNLNTFLNDATDERWYVEVLLAGGPEFNGFLSLSDISQPFTDDFNYAPVTLSATDGLVLLKNIPLTKPDGTNPKGKFKIIEYVSWCLQKTGLSLPITVINNVMEEHYIGLPAWDNIYLEAKTFEAEIGKSEDCYTVLEKILGESCYLCQHKAGWFIRNINEVHGDYNDYIDRYTAAGVYINTVTGLGYHRPNLIGLNKLAQFVQTDASVMPKQRVKYVKETYNYEYPKEIVDNIDFVRGDQYFVVGPPPPGHVWYHVDDWELKRGITNPDQTVTTFAYIDRRFEDGYEKERYVGIAKDTTGNTAPHELRSSKFPIQKGDKVRFNVDRRYAGNFNDGSGTFVDNVIASMRLITPTGTLSYDPYDGRWAGNPTKGFSWTFNSADVDESEWVSFSMTSMEAPVDGEIQIVLYQNDRHINSLDVHFSNVQVEYIPKINGSFQKYYGQYEKIEDNVAYKQKREKTVYLSDAPKKLFKGALLRKVGSNYLLAGRWYDGSTPYRLSPTDAYLHPFGYNQAYAVYNEYNRVFRKLDGEVLGFGGELPTSAYIYTLNYNSPHTNGKQFLLLHYEISLQRCRWSGVFAEAFDRAIPRQYPLSSHEFKYIENR